MSNQKKPHLPERLELTINGQSIQDAELTAIIVATANKPEWAEEIVRRYNGFSVIEAELKVYKEKEFETWKNNNCLFYKNPNKFQYEGDGRYYNSDDLRALFNKQKALI